MVQPPCSGNPILAGWYADPEVTVFGNRYWIYPTFSAPYAEQLHFDAFSSPDLVHWTRPNYSVAYAIRDSPLGPFKRIGKILQQDPAVATGAGHHSVLHIPGSDDWHIVYHRRPLAEKDANHRVTCIDRMEFDAATLRMRMARYGLPDSGT